jgi:hypothetical protein
VIWSTAREEKREFAGATCDRTANAATLQQLADRLERPIDGWVTQSRHGHDLWDHGREIIAGYPPGTPRAFRSTGRIPNGAVCR